MVKAAKNSSLLHENKQSVSSAIFSESGQKQIPSERKMDVSESITGRMRERKKQSHMQMIASILTKRRTRKTSELKNASDQQNKINSATKRATGRLTSERLVKRTLQKNSAQNLIRKDTSRRHRKSSDKKGFSTRSETLQQEKARGWKWKEGIKILAKENPEGTDDADDLKKKRRRRKKRKRNQDVPQDEVLCVKRRIRYLLIKMKQEQNLIDAYSGEGWKGQSREKLRPEKELQRAGNQILKCKLGIREAIHRLDLIGAEGSIADSVIDSEGRIYHEHIFCAECKMQDTLPDNDIILCDGACNRGFHQKCLNPPLATENIPPGDQGWLCKVCECKSEGLEAINAYLGTQFTVTTRWEEIFVEAAKVANGETTSAGPDEEWPSDDSEDDDYDPEKQEIRNETGYENDSDDSVDSGSTDYLSESDISETSLTNDLCLDSLKQKLNEAGDKNMNEIITCIDSDGNEDSCIPVTGKRQRRDVDYKKLNDEMFGKEESDKDELSVDEDWGPQKRARKEKQQETNAGMASEENTPLSTEQIVKEERLSQNDVKTKRHIVRLPADAVEELRKVFAENELPSRSFKENLSQKLGLTFGKVHMWFKNARYMALKGRKEVSVKERTAEAEQTGEDNPANKKFKHMEKKNEASCLKSSVGTDHASRITKRKHMRRNIKTSLPIPSGNEKKRTICRLPANAVERLRQAFAENQLPSMSNKVSLSKQLGLPFRQVHMWFKNTRYMALKRKKMEAKLTNTETKSWSTARNESNQTNQEPCDDGSSYLHELEMLNNIETKLEKLRKTLDDLSPLKNSSCSNCAYVEGSTDLVHKDCIMYVPVAELREKSLPFMSVR